MKDLFIYLFYFALRPRGFSGLKNMKINQINVNYMCKIQLLTIKQAASQQPHTYMWPLVCSGVITGYQQ